MPDGLSPEPRDCPSVLCPHDGRVASLRVCVGGGGGSFSLFSTKLLLTAAASGVVAVPRVSSAHCRASV